MSAFAGSGHRAAQPFDSYVPKAVISPFGVAASQ
jgi:hypothetical protein